MMTTFIKQNCEPGVDNNSLEKISSKKQFYADSKFSEIYSGDKIPVNIAEKEVEQLNYEKEADSEIKGNITSSEKSNLSEINTGENISVENGSITFGENIQRLQKELKSVSEYSAKLETKLENKTKGLKLHRVIHLSTYVYLSTKFTYLSYHSLHIIYNI